MDTPPTPIDCDDALLLLAAADERPLDDAERARLDAHTTACARCRDAAGAPDPADPADPAAPAASAGPAAPDDDADLRALPVIDPALYAWAETIGRGGMGRVMAARDRRLGRRVAIKELIARGLEDRFETEARITARLEHPAIVHVHEAGRWPSGELFYAMKLVEGAPLSALIRERDTLAARIALLPNVMTVVDAIAYAHSKGVIHRDLKPSNIVVGAFGETVVIDWGLAKDLADLGDLPGGAYRGGGDGATEAGLGTLQYMPPEQARGEVPDRRVDVYALGATLYHVLAGAAPYGGLGPAEVLARLLEAPPPPIERLQPGVPRDLAAIVAKAMARAPGDRYPDAGALAADLRRFEAGQLVSASTYSTWSLARRWLGRHRALVAAAAVMLALGTAGAAYSVDKILDERAAARHARDVAVHERAAGLAELGRIELLAGDGQRAAPYLFEALAAEPTDRTRLLFGEAMRSFDALLLRHNAKTAIEAAALSPDGMTIAVAADGELTVMRLDDLRERARHAALDHDTVLDVAWDDGGTSIVVGGLDNRASVWAFGGLDADLAATWSQSHGHAVREVAPQPGGEVLSVSDDGTLRRWRPGGGGTGGNDRPGDVRYRAPRGRSLLAVDPGGTRALIVPDGTGDAAAEPADAPGAELVDLATGAVVHAVTSDPPDVAALTADLLAFSAGSAVSIIRLAPAPGAADPAALAPAPHAVDADAGAIVTRLAISGDGRLVAAGDASGRITVWDAATGAVRARVTGHRGQVTDVGFDRAARRLVTAGDDGFARVWDVPRLLEATPLRGGLDAPELVAVGGNTVAMAQDGAFVVAHGDRRHRVPASVDARAIALTRRGDRLLVLDRGVESWDVASGTRLARVDGDMHGLVLSPDGRTAATLERDVVVLRDVATLAPTATLAGLGARVTSVRFTPDGAVLATARDGTHRSWRLDPTWRAAEHVPALEADHAILAGDVLITGGVDGRLAFRDARRLDRTFTKHSHPAPITAMAAPRDGGVFASASTMIEVRACGARDARGDLDDDEVDALFTIAATRGAVGALAFTTDGALLAVGDASGTVELWDVATGSALLRLPPRSSEIRTLAFTSDGRWLVVAEASGPPQVWAVPREERDMLAISRHLGRHLAWVVHEGRLRTFRDAGARAPRRFVARAADATYDFSGTTIHLGEPAPRRTSWLARAAAARPTASRKTGLRRMFHAHEHVLRACAADVARTEPDVRGEVQIGLHVAGSGRVVDAHLRPLPGDHGLAAVSRCIDHAVRRWTFPPVPDAQSVIVYYPVRFER